MTPPPFSGGHAPTNPPNFDTARVTRFEVIDHREKIAHLGRILSLNGVAVTISLQDEGRTLKVFIDDPSKD